MKLTTLQILFNKHLFLNFFFKKSLYCNNCNIIYIVGALNALCSKAFRANTCTTLLVYMYKSSCIDVQLFLYRCTTLLMIYRISVQLF